VNTIVLAPFQFERDALSVSGRAGSLNASFAQILSSTAGIKVITAQEAFPELKSNQSLGQTEVSLSRQLEVARSRGAGAVGRVVVHQAVENQGSAAGSSRPAAVFFTLILSEPEGGRELWQSSYRFIDQPLTDNLLKIGQRGPGFASIDQLFNRGFEQISTDLSAARTLAFTSKEQ
jgi:hypothetical protein